MGFILGVVGIVLLLGLMIITDFARVTLTLLNSHLTKIRPYVNEAASEPNNGTASTARSEEQLAFSNVGNQNIRGFANLTGIVRGNGNGAIRGLSANELLIFRGPLNSIVDGTTQNRSPTTPLTDHPTDMPGMYYNNRGDQSIMGLANQTGIIDGNDNGSIDSRRD